MDVKITGLSPNSLYSVAVKSRAGHANDADIDPVIMDKFINKSPETKCEFMTANIPSAIANIKVASATTTAIKLRWDAISTQDSLVTAIQVEVSPVTLHNRTLHFSLPPETKAFSFGGLTCKTNYDFTFDLVTEDHLLSGGLTAYSLLSHFQTFTNGFDPPGKPCLMAKTQTSLAIEWGAAKPYGLFYVQHYSVHYAENRLLRRKSRHAKATFKDFAGSVMVAADCLSADLRELEPGVTYKIVVEAVIGVKNDDGECESEDDDGNSNASSMPSIRTRDEEEELCLSDPMFGTTTAVPEPPVLRISEISTSQVHLCWDQPTLLKLGKLCNSEYQFIRRLWLFRV